MKYYHPVEEETKLSNMTNSELHRLLLDYRWVHAAFIDIAGRARQRVKSIQTLLMRRGAEHGGYRTEPNPSEAELARAYPSILCGGITDHAVVRYLERVKGVDIKAVEAEMMEKINSGTPYFGGAVVVDDDGTSYIRREDGLVKSVMPHDWLDEADKMAAEHSHKIKKRKVKDDTFRDMAARGIDTTPRIKDGQERASS